MTTIAILIFLATLTFVAIILISLVLDECGYFAANPLDIPIPAIAGWLAVIGQ